MVKVVGPRDPQDCTAINCTSRSRNWSKGLSPFYLGPIKLYGDYVALNMENAWQFSKVYKQHMENGEPTEDYFDWAVDGWNDPKAQRYPMGKGARPEYSWWDGKKLPYIEARKQIYVPLYGTIGFSRSETDWMVGMSKRAYLATVELEYLVVAEDSPEGVKEAKRLALRSSKTTRFPSTILTSEKQLTFP